MQTETTFRQNFLLSDWQKFNSLTTKHVDKAEGKSLLFYIGITNKIGTKDISNNYQNLVERTLATTVTTTKARTL